MRLTLSILPETLAVCRLPADAEFPPWAVGENLLALARTKDEVSVVCPESDLPDGLQSEGGWRALKVQGPLDFALVGILAELAGVLADAGVSIFAVSTFDTDYVLIKENQLGVASSALRQAGHEVRDL